MKIIKQNILIFILFKISIATTKMRSTTTTFNRNVKCIPEVPESYDLEGSRMSLSYHNQMCPQVRDNCCTYEGQLMMYKNWKIHGTRDKILNLYKDFKTNFENIF